VDRRTCRAWPDLEGRSPQLQSMAGNLTAQVRNIAEVTTAVRAATFPQDHRRGEGRDPRPENTINTMVDHLNSLHRNDRRGALVGTEGNLAAQAECRVSRAPEGLTDTQLHGIELTGRSDSPGCDSHCRRRPLQKIHGRLTLPARSCCSRKRSTP